MWLLSDVRNDAVLEAALVRLPRGSGFVFRHYHLPPDERRARFGALAELARGRDHLVILASDPDTALEWAADGIYGPPAELERRTRLLQLATVHDEQEIALADRVPVDGMVLSPVFPTRSHPGGVSLGKDRFLALAALAKAPVIALGGMNPERAAELGWRRWAAIDALSQRDS